MNQNYQGNILWGGLIVQRYKKQSVINMVNSNNSIIFIEKVLITKELNSRDIARRYSTIA